MQTAIERGHGAVDEMVTSNWRRALIYQVLLITDI